MNKKSVSLRTLLVISIILIIHLLAYFLIKDHGLMVDEKWHYAQIVEFTRHNYALNPGLAMLPGYHFVIAGVALLVNASSVPAIRFISLFFNLITIPVFYFIAKKIDYKSALVKTVQYSFFPILFPFYTLIYTDFFSLTLILLAVYFIFRKRYNIAGLILSVDVLVRQNNLIWLVFFNIYIYLKTYGFVFRLQYLNNHMKNTMSFILGPIIFDIFLMIFHRVSVGEQTLVYATAVVPNNLFIMLFMFLIIFLPLNISLIKQFIVYWRKKIIFLLPVLLAFFPFSKYFRVENPYNLNTFFLHNWLFVYFTSGTYQKLIFFVILILTVMLIRIIKLHSKEDYLLYLFTIIFFIPLWFIDVRYYMVPLSLFILFKKNQKKSIEIFTAVYFILLSAICYYGIFTWKFFI